MEFVRRTRRWAAWLAVFAMLLSALAPSVSHAVSMQRGGPAAVGADFCTSVPPAAPRSDAGPVHCPFCLVHAGSFALPPRAVDTLVPAAEPAAAVLAGPERLRHPVAPGLAQPRGPPGLS